MKKSKATVDGTTVQTKLPDVFVCRVVRKGERATFVFEETFDDKAIVRRTVDAVTEMGSVVSPWLKVAASKDGLRVRLSGEAPYHTVADMIACEFMGWSRIGDMRLRDLFISRTMQLAKSHQKLTAARGQIEKIKKLAATKKGARK